MKVKDLTTEQLKEHNQFMEEIRHKDLDLKIVVIRAYYYLKIAAIIIITATILILNS